MATNRSVWASLAIGTIGGLAGAVAMNQFQSLWSSASKAMPEEQRAQQKQQPRSQDEDATQAAARVISQHVFNHEPTKPEKKNAASAVHYGIGALMGAVYGVAAETLPISRAGRGMLYGGAVWLFADEIAVPAFGLSGSPMKTPLSTHAESLSSHLLYGFVTDLALRTVLGNKAG